MKSLIGYEMNRRLYKNKIDEKYMRLALKLALKAQGRTSPNPIVGAVIVKNGRVVGTGYHKKCGQAHAEVNAIRRAGKNAQGADMYVTLEPCNHFGRTPPCTDAIIASGIKTVIVGMTDPNPVNNGKGIRKLNRSGVKTVCGILREEAAAINRPFIKFITTALPYITVKIAETIDGKIATRTGDSRWITSEESRKYVHQLRKVSDAVMVGVNTVIRDDPMLLSKSSKDEQPARIIVDSGLRTPLKSRIFSNTKNSAVVIATAKRPPSWKVKKYEERGALIITAGTKNGKVDLAALAEILAGMGMINILAEGGGELSAGLLKYGLVDRFLFFIAPKIIGGRDAVTSIEGEGVLMARDAVGLKGVTMKSIGSDILVEAEVN